MTLPSRSIFAFHMVARHGGLTRAGEEMGVTPSALRQHIKQLESHLGATLFKRIGKNLALTEIGEQYYADIYQSIEQIHTSTQRVRGKIGVQRLRLRISPTFATKWLNARIESFIRMNERFEVHIDASSEPAHFFNERVDLDIRYGTNIWSGLFVEPLVEYVFRPLCSPKLAAAGTLEPAQLTDYRLIHSVKNVVQWPEWLASHDVGVSGHWRRTLFDRGHMALDFAARGNGIALEGDLVARDAIAAGELVCPVDPQLAIRRIPLWLVCPHQHLKQKKVTNFIEWLRAEIAADA